MTTAAAPVDSYPMPSFTTLVVADIAASDRFYCEALGFVRVIAMPGPGGIPALVHVRWRRYADLLLFPDREGTLAGKVKGVGFALNFMADDVVALAARAREHGVPIVEGPIDRPWNACQLTIDDPDGYRLVFNGPPQGAARRTMDEILESAAKGFA